MNEDKSGYRGPILFSWADQTQFNNFLLQIKKMNLLILKIIAPWLLKILSLIFQRNHMKKSKIYTLMNLSHLN